MATERERDDLLRELAARGWIVVDDLGREIIGEAIQRWGEDETRARLAEQLAGPDPTYALESLGAALGPEFECPLQLVRGPAASTREPSPVLAGKSRARAPGLPLSDSDHRT